jgi:hypothetical protein
MDSQCRAQPDLPRRPAPCLFGFHVGRPVATVFASNFRPAGTPAATNLRLVLVGQASCLSHLGSPAQNAGLPVTFN